MSKISENDDFQLLQKEVEIFEQAEFFLQFVNFELSSSIKDVCQKTKDLNSIADEFNDIFSDHGWIATEDMSVNLMKQAVGLYKKNGLENAEEFFCNCFDDDYFSLHCHRMNVLYVWGKNRDRLLRLAYKDHKQGRYHASIPVVLALIDGLSFDTSKATFYNNKKNSLIIENSVAAHESGLNRLSESMNKNRSKTQNNPLDFPYRNGILHGRELAYDNKLVSTKCFYILLAMRSWALECQKVEYARQKGIEHEGIPGFTAGDLLKQKIREFIES